MNYPADLKYTREHEWIRDNGDGTATVGVTDFAQSELGDVVFVEFSDVDTEVSKDESFGTIEAVKTVSDLFAPISGKILELNESLADEPEVVNVDPYDKGWMIKMSIKDAGELDDLMDVEAYQKIIS